MVLWKHTRNISLALPEELLVEVDEAAKAHLMSRSQYIRTTLQKAIFKRDPKDRYKKKGNEPWLYDLDDS